jgi:tetratricopeptide (TPR) repeat protein
VTSDKQIKTGMRAWRIGVRLAFIAAMLVASAQAQTSEEWAQQAAAALEKQDYAAAAKALESYLAQNPQDSRAKFNLALAYSMTGRETDAIRLYQEILVQQSDLVPARTNLGILLLAGGDASGALEQFQKVIDQQPEHWAAQVNRAAALVALNRLPEAREAYEKALQLKPDHAPTHLAYAKVLATSDSAIAEQHLRRALELDSTLEEARLLLAVVLEDRAGNQTGGESGDGLTEAAGIYQKFLEAHPGNAEVRARLGEIYLEQKHFSDAIRELEAVRSIGRADAAVNDALLHAYLEAKQNDKALALLPDLLAAKPDNSELHLLRGSLLMEKRQYPDAAVSFRRASELAPNSPEGFTNLASALYLMKDYPGTVAALEKIGALGKDTAGSYFLRAISLEKLSRKQPALDNYQMFLAADGKKNPDQEFQARQRSAILARELKQKPRR